MWWIQHGDILAAHIYSLLPYPFQENYQRFICSTYKPLFMHVCFTCLLYILQLFLCCGDKLSCFKISNFQPKLFSYSAKRCKTLNDTRLFIKRNRSVHLGPIYPTSNLMAVSIVSSWFPTVSHKSCLIDEHDDHDQGRIHLVRLQVTRLVWSWWHPKLCEKYWPIKLLLKAKMPVAAT